MSIYAPFAFIQPPPVVIPTIITANLQQWLDANKTASNPGSGTTWNDISGNSRNATLINGAAFGSSGAIKYVSFDGSNDYVDAGNFLANGYQPFTLQFWIYDTNGGTGQGVYSSKWENTGRRQWLIMSKVYGVEANGDVGWLLDATGNFTAGDVIGTGTASTISAATWTNWAFTYDGQTATLYKNGSSVNSQAYGTTKSLNNFSWNIMFGRDGAGRYLNGRIGQHLYYNTNLSGTNILYNYNITKADYGL